MHGVYQKSRAQRAFLAIGHLAVVMFCWWLLLGGGLVRFGLPEGDSYRRIVLLVCSSVYFVRMSGGLFGLMKRSVEWQEALIVLLWLAVIHVSFAFLGGTSAAPLSLPDGLFLAMYAIGSYLNTASEIQRKHWKQNHPGKLYTGGLFGLSRHINFFGDSLLFTGFCLLTRSAWAVAIPAIMTAGFLFQHIPALETYLQAKYGEDFRLYQARTKRFVPFVF